jgi:16S rRNA (cytidine1402-2'-O)-methyltransferase
MGTLSIVATPIGNLEDLTFRAARVLKEADYVLCEDTRVTKRLLARYEIDTPTMSYHQHSTLTKVGQICDLLEAGKHLALVSDAGTPSISDPGALLVSKVRERFGGSSAEDVSIVAVPGPSALTAALSVAGIPSSEFSFLGFLPHKKGREKRFSEIAAAKTTVVFYESPHRILKTLDSLARALEPSRRVSVCRELTKIYEEVVRGTPAEVTAHFNDHPEAQRGEFVVIVSEN